MIHVEDNGDVKISGSGRLVFAQFSGIVATLKMDICYSSDSVVSEEEFIEALVQAVERGLKVTKKEFEKMKKEVVDASKLDNTLEKILEMILNETE